VKPRHDNRGNARQAVWCASAAPGNAETNPRSKEQQVRRRKGRSAARLFAEAQRRRRCCRRRARHAGRRRYPASLPPTPSPPSAANMRQDFRLLVLLVRAVGARGAHAQCCVAPRQHGVATAREILRCFRPARSREVKPYSPTLHAAQHANAEPVPERSKVAFREDTMPRAKTCLFAASDMLRAEYRHAHAKRNPAGRRPHAPANARW